MDPSSQTKRKVYLDLASVKFDPAQAGTNMQVQAIKEREAVLALAARPDIPWFQLRTTDPLRNDAKGRFHPVDLFALSAHTYPVGELTARDDIPFIAEIKCRNYASTDHSDWTIELQKLASLRRWVSDHVPQLPVRILYINFFTDGICLIWDITNTRPFREELTKKKWPNRDAEGNVEMRHKRVGYYRTVDAQRIDMNQA